MREGCPHCAAAEAFLATLAKERPELEIAIRDVGKEPSALARLKEIAKAQGTDSVRVPAVFLRGQLIVGFSPEANTDKLIRAALAPKSAATAAPAAADGAAACDAEESLSCKAGPEAASGAEQFEVTIFGRAISLDDVGMPLFTVVMGLLDGFNPCSMWVLILMISLLAPLNNRPRMLAIAGTFVLHRGHRLLRVHGSLAQPVPVHRAFARIGAGHRRHRHLRRARQSEGLPGTGVGVFPLHSGRRQTRHLRADARDPARRKSHGCADRHCHSGSFWCNWSSCSARPDSRRSSRGS